MENLLSSSFDNGSNAYAYKALGDSITYGYGSNTNSYADRLNGIFGFGDYQKLAVNGTSVMYNSSRSYLLNQINQISTGFKGLITIMCGVNDYRSNHTLGNVEAVLQKDFSALTPTASFAEALRYELEYILRNIPGAVLVYILPLHHYYASSTNSLDDYRVIIRRVCEFLSVPCLKTYKKCNVSSATFGVYTTDNLHLNDAGQQLVANSIKPDLYDYLGMDDGLPSYTGIMPTMTAANVPSPFVVSQSSQITSAYAGWKVFDGKTSTPWSTANGIFSTSTFVGNAYIQVDMGSAYKVAGVKMIADLTTTSAMPATFEVQASNNGSTFETIYRAEGLSWVQNESETFYFDNNSAYRYWRLAILKTNGQPEGRGGIGTLQFYQID